MFRLDRFLTLYFFQPLMKRFAPSAETSIPILMYHSISDDPENGVHPYYRVNTSPGRFAQQMKFLSYNKYRVVSLSEAVNFINKPVSQSTNQPVNHVVLTFDDGFRDFLEHAWPVLRNFRQTASVFLPTAFIGASRKTFKGRECLTWPEVRELHSQGVSFGSHTISHPNLYALQWKDVQRELLESRLQIERELQAPTTHFSYPYAFPQEDREFALRFTKELVDHGYRTAVTTVIGRAELKSDPLRLERLPVNDFDDEQLFKAKLAGAYDWMAKVQVLFRRLKSWINWVKAQDR